MDLKKKQKKEWFVGNFFRWKEDVALWQYEVVTPNKKLQ